MDAKTRTINSEKSWWLRFPSSLNLAIFLPPERTLLQMCQLILPILAATDLPPIQEWQIPTQSLGNPRQSGDLQAQLQHLQLYENQPDAPHKARFFLAENIWLYISPRKEPTVSWELSLVFFVRKHHTPADLTIFADAALEICRQLLRQTQVDYATLYRRGGGGKFIPDVPIVGSNKHLVLTTQAKVEQNYSQPELFWNAPFWSSIEQYNDQYLLVRALHAFENLEFICAVYDYHWQLARVVKPGVMKYYFPVRQPEEESIYHAGEPRLQRADYLPEQRLVIFSCHLAPDEKINGWEIYEIRHLTQSKKLPDGREVDKVQIIFDTRSCAEREKRPLLDVGAQVWYYNSQGSLEQIVEEKLELTSQPETQASQPPSVSPPTQETKGKEDEEDEEDFAFIPSKFMPFIDLPGESLEHVCRDLFEGLATIEFPAVIAWSVCDPDPLEYQENIYLFAGLEQAIGQISLMAQESDPPTIARFKFVDRHECTVWYYSESSTGKGYGRCFLEIVLYQEEEFENLNFQDIIPRWAQAVAQLFRHFLRQGKVNHQPQVFYAEDVASSGAGMYRFGTPYYLPDLPLATAMSFIDQIIVTSIAEVELNYDRPSVFWEAWDSIEQYGELYLCLRGLDCNDDQSLILHIVERQWNLARAVKSHLALYDTECVKEKLPYLKNQQSSLREIDRENETEHNTIEYACDLSPGDHIQPWELCELWDTVQESKYKNLKIVIMFDNRAIAEQEKRPLLDMGVEVWYYNSEGEAEQIFETSGEG